MRKSLLIAALSACLPMFAVDGEAAALPTDAAPSSTEPVLVVESGNAAGGASSAEPNPAVTSADGAAAGDGAGEQGNALPVTSPTDTAATISTAAEDAGSASQANSSITSIGTEQSPVGVDIETRSLETKTYADGSSATGYGLPDVSPLDNATAVVSTVQVEKGEPGNADASTSLAGAATDASTAGDVPNAAALPAASQPESAIASSAPIASPVVDIVAAAPVSVATPADLSALGITTSGPESEATARQWLADKGYAQSQADAQAQFAAAVSPAALFPGEQPEATGAAHPAHTFADRIHSLAFSLEGSGDSMLSRMGYEIKSLVAQLKSLL
jgi:hypothetical protein